MDKWQVSRMGVRVPKRVGNGQMAGKRDGRQHTKEYGKWKNGRQAGRGSTCQSVLNMDRWQVSGTTCQLSNIADPFSDLFQTLFSFCSHKVLRAHTSLSLCASALFSMRQRGAALSVKHRYYVVCFSSLCLYSPNAW